MSDVRLSEYSKYDPIVGDLVRAVAVQDECAVVISEADAAMASMLDRVRDELLYRRVRCVRVSAFPLGDLSLRGLMAQILGRPESPAFTDGELEGGFTALTEPGAGYDQIALLIDGAHSLQLPALRYVQLACQSSPKLRVVLAGRPALDSLLARNEFGPLNQRVAQRFERTGPTSQPIPGGRGRRAPPWWLTSLNTGLGALASSALIVALALWVLPAGRPPDLPAAPTVPAGDVGAPAASTPEAATAPLATWTVQPPDASEPAEASISGADPVPALVASDAPPATPPLVPDQPTRLDLPPAEPVPEIRVVDLASELASPRKIEPAVALDQQPDPVVSDVGAPGPTAPRHPPAPSRPQPVRRAAVVAKPAVAPGGSAEGRRCRDIVLNAQLGRIPSHADTLFLQNGCRTE